MEPKTPKTPEDIRILESRRFIAEIIEARERLFKNVLMPNHWSAPKNWAALNPDPKVSK